MRKKLNGDKAVVGLRVNDPFNTNRLRVNVGDDNIQQLTVRSFGVRSAWLTFQFNYGQAPKIREPRPEQARVRRLGGRQRVFEGVEQVARVLDLAGAMLAAYVGFTFHGLPAFIHLPLACLYKG